MLVTAMRDSLIGFRRSWYTDISEPFKSGRFDFVEMSKNRRCSWNPWRTLAAFETSQYLNSSSWWWWPEARATLSYLIGYYSAQALAKCDIFLDGLFYKGVEVLNGLGKWLDRCLRCRGGYRFRCRCRRHGWRGSDVLLEGGDSLRQLDCGRRDVFESGSRCLEPAVIIILAYPYVLPWGAGVEACVKVVLTSQGRQLPQIGQRPRGRE